MIFGTSTVTRECLAQVSETTNRLKPETLIPHIYIANTIEQLAQEMGAEITPTQFILQRKDLDCIFVYTTMEGFSFNGETIYPAFMCKNSNDGRFGITFFFGFVSSDGWGMVLRKQSLIYYRGKEDHRYFFEKQLAAFMAYVERQDEIKKYLQSLSNTTLTLAEGCLQLFELVEKGLLAPNSIHYIYKDYNVAVRHSTKGSVLDLVKATMVYMSGQGLYSQNITTTSMYKYLKSTVMVNNDKSNFHSTNFI